MDDVKDKEEKPLDEETPEEPAQDDKKQVRRAPGLEGWPKCRACGTTLHPRHKRCSNCGAERPYDRKRVIASISRDLRRAEEKARNCGVELLAMMLYQQQPQPQPEKADGDKKDGEDVAPVKPKQQRWQFPKYGTVVGEFLAEQIQDIYKQMNQHYLSWENHFENTNMRKPSVAETRAHLKSYWDVHKPPSTSGTGKRRKTDKSGGAMAGLGMGHGVGGSLGGLALGGGDPSRPYGDLNMTLGAGIPNIFDSHGGQPGLALGNQSFMSGAGASDMSQLLRSTMGDSGSLNPAAAVSHGQGQADMRGKQTMGGMGGINPMLLPIGVGGMSNLGGSMGSMGLTGDMNSDSQTGILAHLVKNGAPQALGIQNMYPNRKM
uniref:Uncharacterized protein n=1 Tax=Pinguiococcus pyrenoidosus TaxID=172671 RepID=A0A7R9UDR0_9STRA